jgi:hypothetical protein
VLFLQVLSFHKGGGVIGVSGVVVSVASGVISWDCTVNNTKKARHIARKEYFIKPLAGINVK